MYDDYIERHIPHGRDNIPFERIYKEYEDAPKRENAPKYPEYKNIYHYDTEKISDTRYNAENNIYNTVNRMYDSIYNINESSGLLHNESFVNNYRESSLYNGGNVYENSFYGHGDGENSESYYYSYDNGIVNNSYENIVGPQVKDSITNNVSNDGRSISISLGGITQNFSGVGSGEDIVQEICMYLEQALGTMAEGVYF